MYDFIRLQYQMGNIDEQQVRSFVPTWITTEQADKILRGSKND